MKKLIELFFNKQTLWHLAVIFGFGLFSVLFFYPVMSGKSLIQSDISQYTAMSKQLQDYRENNDEEIYWIDNAFGGMPTYQLGARYPYDFLTPIHKVFQLIPQPAEILFLYLFSAYLFLLIIKMPIPIAVFGALAYGLSTYLLIILQVGHNTKAQALAYIPLVIGGMYMILNEKRFWGFALTVVALSMQIRANHYHPQQEQKCLFTKGQIIEIFQDIINPNAPSAAEVVYQYYGGEKKFPSTFKDVK